MSPAKIVLNFNWVEGEKRMKEWLQKEQILAI